MLDSTLDGKNEERIGSGDKILVDSNNKNQIDKKRNTQPKQTNQGDKSESKIGQGSKFAKEPKKQFDPKTAKKKDRLNFVKG